MTCFFYISKMYLGIDFLITSELKLYLVEINVGLPGGAHEYHLAHRVHFGKPSDIFTRIERTSRKIYGKTFKDYLHSLPFIESLKPLKIWMDGMGPLPKTFHPGLRLEDKWNQYQLIHPIAPMPETIIFDPEDLIGAERFIERKKKVVLKRRVGRGGRDFKVISEPFALRDSPPPIHHYLLQEYVESKINGYSLSIRAVAFGGKFMCMYANLSTKTYSNHGNLFFISPGTYFGLSKKNFKTQSFNQKSWEAKIWFGENEPPYLKHNLYEDDVAKATLFIPPPILKTIKELTIKVERFYDSLDLLSLPKACFED
ncbi:MAG: hypothetical protein HXY44_10670 [Syntrophaceae bacterium]|nr:hypothetical protein [Syntrophaceae bacterium]